VRVLITLEATRRLLLVTMRINAPAARALGEHEPLTYVYSHTSASEQRLVRFAVHDVFMRRRTMVAFGTVLVTPQVGHSDVRRVVYCNLVTVRVQLT
jgi:hypothetical protein